MTKFLFMTQTDSSVWYQAKVHGYQILRGIPVIVTESADIEFFRNKRQFKELGLFEKAPKLEDDGPTKFSKLVNGFKFLSESNKRLLIRQFETEDNLRDHARKGGGWPEEFSKKEMVQVDKFFKIDRG